MALPNSSIATVSETVSRIEANYENIISGSNTFRYVMSNSDFTKFAADTNLGQDAQEKIIQLINIINGGLQEQMSALVSDTRNFLDLQSQLNARSVN